MVNYSLQFDAKDVMRFFEESRGLSGQNLQNFTWDKKHNIGSPTCSLIGYGSELANPEGGLLLENLLQREYIQSITCLASEQFELFKKLVNFVRDGEWDQDKASDVIRPYLRKLTSFTEFLPILENVDPISSMSEEQLDYARNLEGCAKVLVYSSNSLYSPEFKRDTYYLDRDVDRFVDEAQRIMKGEDIMVNRDNVGPISTPHDYVNNVITQLVWNVRDHAFLDQNDVLERNKEGFTKSIVIFGGNKRDYETQQGEYIVLVQDNGFGIREDIVPTIFERGVSSKPKDGTDHGIGLWSAQRYVEERGGKISVKTTRGEGSTFSFTIPYQSLNELMMPVQEK